MANRGHGIAKDCVIGPVAVPWVKLPARRRDGHPAGSVSQADARGTVPSPSFVTRCANSLSPNRAATLFGWPVPAMRCQGMSGVSAGLARRRSTSRADASSRLHFRRVHGVTFLNLPVLRYPAVAARSKPPPQIRIRHGQPDEEHAELAEIDHQIREAPMKYRIA